MRPIDTTAERRKQLAEILARGLTRLLASYSPPLSAGRSSDNPTDPPPTLLAFQPEMSVSVQAS
jgi:hypothetical protein